MNLVKDLSLYSDKLLVSQVIKFFDNHGIEIKKTTIQHYVRIGLIPQPQSRYYSKDHVLLLYVIDGLKEIYTLNDIKKIFTLVDLDAINIYTIYVRQLNMAKHKIEDSDTFRLMVHSLAIHNIVKNSLSI